MIEIGGEINKKNEKRDSYKIFSAKTLAVVLSINRNFHTEALLKK
jgi:hypothetical protein